jgi:hypothetical protein
MSGNGTTHKSSVGEIVRGETLAVWSRLASLILVPLFIMFAAWAGTLVIQASNDARDAKVALQSVHTSIGEIRTKLYTVEAASTATDKTVSLVRQKLDEHILGTLIEHARRLAASETLIERLKDELSAQGKELSATKATLQGLRDANPPRGPQR